MIKTLAKFVLLIAATMCAAQQGSVQKEGSSWTSVATGALTGVHNLHIKVEVGGVRVEGGSSQGVSYVIRNRSYGKPIQRNMETYGKAIAKKIQFWLRSRG